MNLLSVIKNIFPYGIINSAIQKKHTAQTQKEPRTPEEPLLYNAKGQRLKTVFLDDYRARDWPYSFVDHRYPENIFWDRFNYGLKNHVYSHDKIPRTIGKPEKKFAILLEGESIDPKTYALFDKHSGLDREFDLIFTHSAALLDKYANAVFIPSGGVYYGVPHHGGTLDSGQYQRKTKNISIVSSHKVLCELHKFRLALARHYKNSSLVDTYGSFDGGAYIKISESLADYRYSIAIENDITPYRFTEKLLNCFAAMVIPVYVGATDTGNYFNNDGIIRMPELSVEAVDKLIKQCTQEYYEEHLPAIIDNYNRVYGFLCIEDFIWKNYRKHFI